MTKRKSLSVMVGAIILGALFYVAVWPFVVGGSNMQSFCQSLAKGVLISRVRDIAEENRYRMTPPDKTGRAFIHDTRAFGRFICEVQFKEERLTSARYQQND
jgi:hypothetical protein